MPLPEVTNFLHERSAEVGSEEEKRIRLEPSARMFAPKVCHHSDAVSFRKIWKLRELLNRAREDESESGCLPAQRRQVERGALPNDLSTGWEIVWW